MTDDWTLITGAASGIGQALAVALSAERRLILHDRDDARLEPTRARCANSEEHRLWSADLADPDKASRSLAQLLASKSFSIAAFVHCAGLTLVAPIRETDPVTAMRLFSVNVISAVTMLQTIAAADPGRKHLRNVLLISSAASRRGEKGAALYSASKGAIDALVLSLAVELAPQVRVNALLPGIVRTPMSSATIDSPQFQAQVGTKYPLGAGIPDDLIGGAEFLLSEKARWVTGALWSVDGGRTAA